MWRDSECPKEYGGDLASLSTIGASLPYLQDSSLNCRREQARPWKSGTEAGAVESSILGGEVMPAPTGQAASGGSQPGPLAAGHSRSHRARRDCPPVPQEGSRPCRRDLGGAAEDQHPQAPCLGEEGRVGVCPLGYLMPPKQLKDPCDLLGTSCFHRASDNPGPGQSWDLSTGLPRSGSRRLGQVRHEVGTTAVSAPLSSVRQQVGEQVQEDEQQRAGSHRSREPAERPGPSLDGRHQAPDRQAGR